MTAKGIQVEAFRISYVGEQGWEPHVAFSYGLSLWDLVYELKGTKGDASLLSNFKRWWNLAQSAPRGLESRTQLDRNIH